MKLSRHTLVGTLLALLATAAPAEPPKEAQVTQIIREVKLLPANADERDALVDDKVSEDTGVRTGGDSRSELTFADLTITRLGANTIFSFNKAGRTVNLESGSVLLRVPKNSGGGTIRNNVVTVAITGTTVILETGADGGSKLIVLEGTARLEFTKDARQTRRVRAAQMLDVPAGATNLPTPVNIDLDQLMRTHPLIVDFGPLPSLPLIQAVTKKQPPAPPSRTPPPPPSVVKPSPTPTGPASGGSGKSPRPFPTPRRNIDPTPTAPPDVTRPPRFSPTPKPIPTPREPNRPTPTPKPPPPKATPTASPKQPRPPTTNPPGTTKPPAVLGTEPTPSPTPVILRKAPAQTGTKLPASSPSPRFRQPVKKSTPPPIR
ncbi:MAG TPA: FecR domain-containing protein [Chthoniobacterales bacterium]|nr:FecR domain-containing protein [Chthoniobacterales bacterium]